MTELRAELHELRNTANALADAARLVTLKHFRDPSLVASSKRDDFDPVTVADRAAEEAMRNILEKERPEDGVLGEEHGTIEGTSGLTWVLDPIDGTRGYISGTPTWGVLISVRDAEGPFLGLIDQPYIGERFYGGPDGASMTGPHWNRPLRTSGQTALAEATLFTTFPEIGTSQERRAFEAVEHDVRLTRYGCDCYAYALLAAGHVDLVIETGLQPYDIQAPISVIRAAGGVVTNWTGGPAHDGGRVVAAATPELHMTALERLASAL